MNFTTLQQRLDAAGSAVAMLSAPMPPYTSFPYPPVYTNWQEEQRASKTTAVLFDQSYHMTDCYITGPDAVRLLSDTAVNSFATFGPGKAKQYLAVNEDGFVIADGLLFGLAEDAVVVTGNEIASNWLRYQAELGGYDVQIEVEDRGNDGPVPKRMYRFELEGPWAWKILESAHGGHVERIPFFAMSEVLIGGLRVGVLNHTMGGTPGDDASGLELFGPMEEKEAFLAAILQAGAPFGLLRGGALAYLSAAVESGWVPLPIPAIFGENMRPYREWLSAYSTENWVPINGSFRSDRIEDYYGTPWDFGWERFVRFDHDFIGRAALERLSAEPNRTKVWLSWNRDDAARVIGSSYVDGDDRAKPLEIPTTMLPHDEVRLDGHTIGIARMHGYTVNLAGWTSIARVDVSEAIDGREVELVWGDPDGGASNPFVPPHRQTIIRATIATAPPMARASSDEGR
ncbi:aminomethyl transferase family protein [Microbacterium sp. A8/3-1]|uniref:Aminomethyl transferase family protein n=1 Tax=Microbacterium sp. A8/3-1 TaxID=3160749 RepID=A0AAU7W243_9MICO